MNYWYSGDARGQGISNHDIEYVEPERYFPRTLRIKLEGDQCSQFRYLRFEMSRHLNTERHRWAVNMAIL